MKQRKMRKQAEQVRGLKELTSTLPYCETMVEIGCYRGESTEIFAQSGKFGKIYAVDPWSDKIWQQRKDKMSEIKRAFDKRIRKYDSVVVMQMRGVDAAREIGDVSFVYIDGLHDYKSVYEDGQAWAPKTKILAFHDYSVELKNFQVKAAVHDLLGEPDRVFEDSSCIFYNVRERLKT
jgi:hypothetical protein